MVKFYFKKDTKIHCNADIFILISHTIKAAERRREDNKMTALQRSRAQREEALLRRKQQFDETLARRQVYFDISFGLKLCSMISRQNQSNKKIENLYQIK